MRLVLDWDGTVTETDTLHMVIERFGDLRVFRRMEAELGSRLTLHEVIAVEMATIRSPLHEVVAWLCGAVTIRSGFGRLVATYEPLIVSAGFHELIEPILAREGVEATVFANHLVEGPDGWEVRFRSPEPCVVCGEPCKRAAVAGVGAFAFAGDGVSDRCVALAADRRFARDGLARWLDERGVPYEPFETLDDVADALAHARSEPSPNERTLGDG